MITDKNIHENNIKIHLNYISKKLNTLIRLFNKFDPNIIYTGSLSLYLNKKIKRPINDLDILVISEEQYEKFYKFAFSILNNKNKNKFIPIINTTDTKQTEIKIYNINVKIYLIKNDIVKYKKIQLGQKIINIQQTSDIIIYKKNMLEQFGTYSPYNLKGINIDILIFYKHYNDLIEIGLSKKLILKYNNYAINIIKNKYINEAILPIKKVLVTEKDMDF